MPRVWTLDDNSIYYSKQLVGKHTDEGVTHTEGSIDGTQSPKPKAQSIVYSNRCT